MKERWFDADLCVEGTTESARISVLDPARRTANTKPWPREPSPSLSSSVTMGAGSALRTGRDDDSQSARISGSTYRGIRAVVRKRRDVESLFEHLLA